MKIIILLFIPHWRMYVGYSYRFVCVKLIHVVHVDVCRTQYIDVFVHVHGT